MSKNKDYSEAKKLLPKLKKELDRMRAAKVEEIDLAPTLCMIHVCKLTMQDSSYAEFQLELGLYNDTK